MELFEGYRDHILHAAGWWAGCCVVFFILTKIWPCNPGQNWWRNPWGALTDVIYGIILLPIVGLVGRIALLWVGVSLFYPKDATPEFTARGWPLWLQCILIVFIQDVMMYWIHRLFHTRHAWAFHAIHHSPETLDWTAASRFHPVNLVAQYVFVDAAVLLMGFSPMALTILMPVLSVYSMLVHANLNWTFGPLRYWVASPVFHRWHHSSQAEAQDKNFAPTFPFLDWIWGTFYMPAGVIPVAYGANEPTMPAGPIGQTLFPFRGSGKWILRHPIVSSIGLICTMGGSYAIWANLNHTIEALPPQASIPVSDETPPQPLPPTLFRDPRQIHSVAVNAHSMHAIYGLRDGSLSIRNLTTGHQTSLGEHKSRINAIAFSPNGKFAASASSDSTGLLFKTENGEVIHTYSQNNSSMMCVAVSEDGWVATGGSDGSIRIWDSRGELAKERRLEGPPINAIAISDAGHLVVVAQGAQVSTWDATNNRLTQCRRLNDLAYCVGVSRDARNIVAGEYNGRLHMWDQGKEVPRLSIEAHTGPIYALSMSPYGELVVTGGADQIARVWSASGVKSQELHGHTGHIFTVSYDMKRQRIIAAGKDGTLTSWDDSMDAINPASATMPIENK